MDNFITLSIVVICVVSMLCQGIAWYLRIPSILFLLISGIILGPVTGFLVPDKLLGDLLFPTISLSVAIILFEGSLTLNFNKISEQRKNVIKFISIGGIITFIGVSLSAHYIFNINYSMSFLLGAILIVTGPTVIGPMLTAIRPSNKVCQLLKWEGMILDPFGAILTVLVFDVVIRTQSEHLLISAIFYFLKLTIVGGVIGYIFGYLLSKALIKHLIPKFLINIVVLNFVLLSFMISNAIYHETGLLAVTVMGLTLANFKNLDLKEILEFKETLSTLLLSSLFILLAARINLSNLYYVMFPATIIFCLMQFLIRPIKVFLTTRKSELNFGDKLMLAWIAPRGIVAAAIASLFELKLKRMGYNDASFLSPVVFLIISYSVILPSFTGKFFAKLIGANRSDSNGILIIGANALSRKIAEIIQKRNYYVLIADYNWDEISTARMNGLKTFFGNPLSEHAEYNLSLLDLGKMMAITPNTELAVLSGVHFKREIEKNEIYYLQTAKEKNIAEKNKIADSHKGKKLFGDNITYEKLLSLLNSTHEIRSTCITNKYTFEDYLTSNKETIIPLFAFDTKNKLVLFSANNKISPDDGWTIVSMMPK